MPRGPTTSETICNLSGPRQAPIYLFRTLFQRQPKSMTSIQANVTGSFLHYTYCPQTHLPARPAHRQSNPLESPSSLEVLETTGLVQLMALLLPLLDTS